MVFKRIWIFGVTSLSQCRPYSYGMARNKQLQSGTSAGFWWMPPCRLRRRKFWKLDYEMVHSEVYLNKYVVSIAPFSTPACFDCSRNIQITALFACFRFLIFHLFFQGGQPTPFAPMCGRPRLQCVDVRACVRCVCTDGSPAFIAVL